MNYGTPEVITGMIVGLAVAALFWITIVAVGLKDNNK